MTDQSTLPFGDQIQANFEKFHRDNPRVWQLWCMFTNQMIKAGFEHGSAKLVAERIRWETSVETTSDPPVKLNNNYTSRYARLWMEACPGWKGFFRTRNLSANSVDSTIGAALHYGEPR
jgi:hypothetical protein